MLSMALEQYKRVKRQIFEWTIASNKKVIKPSVKVTGNNNSILFPLDQDDLDANSDGLKTVNTVLKDGSDLIGTPARFLNNIQQNWTSSLVFISIILITILLLFCFIRYYCCSKRALVTNNKQSLTNALSSLRLRKKYETDEL